MRTAIVSLAFVPLTILCSSAFHPLGAFHRRHDLQPSTASHHRPISRLWSTENRSDDGTSISIAEDPDERRIQDELAILSSTGSSSTAPERTREEDTGRGDTGTDTYRKLKRRKRDQKHHRPSYKKRSRLKNQLTLHLENRADGVPDGKEILGVHAVDFDHEDGAAYQLWREDEYSVASFNMDLQNLALADVQKAQDLVESMEERYQEDLAGKSETKQRYVVPNAASYTILIECWCYNKVRKEGSDEKEEDEYISAEKNVENALKIQALLDYMEQDYKRNNDTRLKPNDLTYLFVCQKWASCIRGDPEGKYMQRAHDIWERLEKGRTVDLYTVIIDGWCRRASHVRHAADRADSVLKQLESHASAEPLSSFEGNATQDGLCPNVLMYTSVLSALAKSRYPDLATRAEGILDRMRKHNVRPDMVTYTAILSAWSKAVSRKERKLASARALELLHEMEEPFLSRDDVKCDKFYHMKPSIATYENAIRAIGNSLDPQAPILAEKLMRRMYNYTETGVLHVPPQVATYNAVIGALCCNAPRNTRQAYAKRAEHLLVEMIKLNNTACAPNERTWGNVLRAWVESGVSSSGEQAQRILQQLEDWHRVGRSPFGPNAVCYTTTMSGWSRSHHRDALCYIDNLLQTMEQKYAETKDPAVRPSEISYATALYAYSRKDQKHAAVRAKATVDRMIRLYSEGHQKGIQYQRPTRMIFNALINVYSRSSQPMQAEKIFQWMEAQSLEGNRAVTPNEHTLGSVLNAWAINARDGGALRAQQILDHIVAREDRGFPLTIALFNTCIKAWARSGSHDAVERAESILATVEERWRQNKDSVPPDVTTYCSLINCCAYYTGDEKGREHALKVALKTFTKLQSPDTNDSANSIAFGTLFKAIGTLVDDIDEQNEMTERYFELCKKMGLVDGFVLSQIRSVATPELYERLILDHCLVSRATRNSYHVGSSIGMVLSKLPQNWKRNADDG